MLEFNSLKTVIPFLIPMLSAMTCSMLLFISNRDSSTRMESLLKRLLLVYYLSMILNWFSILVYLIIPTLFIYLNAFFYMAILMIQVTFYHFVYILTKLDENEHFSPLHYLLPTLICTSLFIWSFFVPFDVQLSITKNRETIPSGYKAYYYLFTSKILIRLLYGAIYMFLSAYRLIRYHRLIKLHPNSDGSHPARWLAVLTGMTIILWIMSTCALIIPRHPIYVNVFAPITILIVVSQHIMLAYNIMKQNYLPLIESTNKRSLFKGILKASKTGTTYSDYTINTKSSKKISVIKSKQSGSVSQIDKKKFEAFMRKHKPFINSNFKITDLVESLGVNRSVISSFINKTYGMNFSQYINQCRLQELDKIIALPANKGKDIASLISQAGFGSYRNYQRIKKTDLRTVQNDKKE